MQHTGIAILWGLISYSAGGGDEGQQIPLLGQIYLMVVLIQGIFDSIKWSRVCLMGSYLKYRIKLLVAICGPVLFVLVNIAAIILVYLLDFIK